ncbi:MAG: radical SAM protein [Desulfobulbaceae bacterium]|nr:MAG: radical SAM protein [Desulfobulbaceae bacterium]
MAGMSNGHFHPPDPADLIPLPQGSELFVLPGRLPVACDPDTSEPLLIEDNPFSPGEPVQAVAAFMAPAHTSIYTSAFQTTGGAPTLPLFAYTAVGWGDGRFWVAAFRSDPDKRQDSDQYSQSVVEDRTRRKLKKFAGNRLIQHLGKCCLVYGCPAARNYFLGRWEAPIPTSPSCNARCVGCISLQPSGCCPSTQERITFVPAPKEISAMAIDHLQLAPNPIVSFGQGCEGEPLLQADTIARAIRMIRKETAKGTINLNSNSSLPGALEQLIAAGLDSLRVSMNSAQKKYYSSYYRPNGYSFDDVLTSIGLMKEAGRFVSLNYFIHPGVTDSPAEFEALRTLLATCRPDMIQLRNLNMDPEWYLRTLDFPPEVRGMGIRAWFAALRKEFPALRFGYFNPYLA